MNNDFNFNQFLYLLKAIILQLYKAEIQCTSYTDYFYDTLLCFFEASLLKNAHSKHISKEMYNILCHKRALILHC